MPLDVSMTEREERLFLLFKKAIESEREAQAMYREAIELCDDPSLISILEQFHEEEVRHEKEILARYNRLRKQVEP